MLVEDVLRLLLQHLGGLPAAGGARQDNDLITWTRESYRYIEPTIKKVVFAEILHLLIDKIRFIIC